MSQVIIAGDTSGTITLQAPAVSGSTTLTLPATSGTVLTTASTAVITQAMLATNVAGNGPAFSAYLNGSQTISATTNTKVQFDAETFDTNNNYDTSNYRFLPTVAGYYQINANVMMTGTSGFLFVMIYKNGTNYSRGQQTPAQATGYPTAGASNVIYCNGTTDYIEIYAFFSATNGVGGGSLGGSTGYSSFTGALVRSA